VCLTKLPLDNGPRINQPDGSHASRVGSQVGQRDHVVPLRFLDGVLDEAGSYRKVVVESNNVIVVGQHILECSGSAIYYQGKDTGNPPSTPGYNHVWQATGIKSAPRRIPSGRAECTVAGRSIQQHFPFRRNPVNLSQVADNLDSKRSNALSFGDSSGD